MMRLRKFWNEEDGVGVVEIILILGGFNCAGCYI